MSWMIYPIEILPLKDMMQEFVFISQSHLYLMESFEICCYMACSCGRQSKKCKIQIIGKLRVCQNMSVS